MAIRRSPEEIGRPGDAIYERDIRPHVRPPTTARSSPSMSTAATTLSATA